MHPACELLYNIHHISRSWALQGYKQVTWRFQCQSRWPFNRNTVLAVGRRRSGTCKGGLPRPPLGSAADIRRHLGVRDLTSVEDLFFSILDVDVINSIGWEVTTFTRTVFDCMLIVIGCFIFNHVGFEVSHRTRKAHLHLGMDPWIHSRYYIKVLGEGCVGIDVLVFYQIFQIFQGYCMYSSSTPYSVKLNCYATSIRNIHISREIKRFKPCDRRVKSPMSRGNKDKKKTTKS